MPTLCIMENLIVLSHQEYYVEDEQGDLDALCSTPESACSLLRSWTHPVSSIRVFFNLSPPCLCLLDLQSSFSHLIQSCQKC